MVRYRVKVHRKGLIVIPAEVRRRFGICEGSYLELVVDGEKAVEVARLISASRRAEVEEEIRS